MYCFTKYVVYFSPYANIAKTVPDKIRVYRLTLFGIKKAVAGNGFIIVSESGVIIKFRSFKKKNEISTPDAEGEDTAVGLDKNSEEVTA